MFWHSSIQYLFCRSSLNLTIFSVLDYNKFRYETPDYIRLSQNIHTGYAQAHNAKLGPEGFFGAAITRRVWKEINPMMVQRDICSYL